MNKPRTSNKILGRRASYAEKTMNKMNKKLGVKRANARGQAGSRGRGKRMG
jgi:hypothetical protein